MLGSTLRRLPLVLLLACACARPGGESAGAVEVEVAGVARTLTQDELAALPVADVSDRGRAYRGVRLRDLLTALAVATDAPLQASAGDGYTQTLAPALLGRDDVIVAYAVDDAPLAAGDGPLRLVVPGSPGLSVRQLVRLGRP